MKTSPAGFTLIELMITLSIVAIMMGIGAPALFSALPGIRVSGAARQILSDLRLARTTAVEKGTPVVVKFHVGATGTYILALDDGDDDYDASNPDDELLKEVPLADSYTNIEFSSASPDAPTSPADGVDLDSGIANAITFNPNGSASEEGEIYIRPAGKTDSTNRRIAIVPSTGNARIESWDGAGWN